MVITDRYDHIIDEKGRLAVPSPIRNAMDPYFPSALEIFTFAILLPTSAMLLVSRLFVGEFFVISCGKQCVQFARILQLELDHPGPVRVFVYVLG